MKKYALENLDDEKYFEKADELYDSVKKTIKEVLDSWEKEEIITEKEKEIALNKWDDDAYGLFSTLLGKW